MKNKILRASVANNLACNTNLYCDSLRASEIAKSGEYFKTNILAAGNCRIRQYTSEKVPAVVTGDKFLHVVTSDNQQYFFFYYGKLYRLVVTSNTSIC